MNCLACIRHPLEMNVLRSSGISLYGPTMLTPASSHCGHASNMHQWHRLGQLALCSSFVNAAQRWFWQARQMLEKQLPSCPIQFWSSLCADRSQLHSAGLCVRVPFQAHVCSTCLRIGRKDILPTSPRKRLRRRSWRSWSTMWISTETCLPSLS